MRVLIVDEVEANSLFFQVILSDLGEKDVFTSTSPAAALELIKKEKIDFIITAWEMSQLPGTIFIQRVRNSRRTRRIPFLIYSKRLSVDDLKLTSDLGMTNVLGMPFDKIKATALLKELFEKAAVPTKEEIKLRKMEDLLVEGKPAECLKFIGPDMTKKGPHLSRFKSLIAEAWLQIGQPGKAEKLLQEALNVDPTNHQAKFLMSRIHSLGGRHDEAIGMLKEMIAGSPVNLSLKVKLGGAMVDADRHEEAKTVLGGVLELDPDCSEVKDELGKIAFKEGDMPLASQLLSETENGEMIARYFNSMAISLVAKSEYDKGIETYKNALEIVAAKAKTHLLTFNLGLAYRKKGDLQMAFRSLVEAYLMAPDYEKAYAGLVHVEREIKKKGLQSDVALIRKVKEVRAATKVSKPSASPADKNVA